MSIGTLLYTWARGRLVGTDEQGNRYYTERRPAAGRRARRWVLYKGAEEPSRVPPQWHGWLHHRVEQPLEAGAGPEWMQPYRPNMTGTDDAYLPPGHDRRGGVRPAATGDYQPWRP